MEGKDEISFKDMTEIVDAMSEVAGRLVPGMVLMYRERLLQHGSWNDFDATECRLLVKAPDIELCVVRGAAIEIGHEPAARKKLLRRVENDGWPGVRSAEEMRLKLAASGDGAFSGICARYAGMGRRG